MLSDSQRATYSWQLDIPGLGEAGQSRLGETTALVSRVGGLGGPLAMSLAAAGIGRIILVHGGNLHESDLNRQTLMSRDWIGRPRADCAAETIARFNPEIEVVPVDENFTQDNSERLVEMADIVFDCAPLFEERFLMNKECVRTQKPLIDSAMYSMQGQVFVVIPGATPCLACIYPEIPGHWRRQFPVIGAVSSMVAQIAAIEGIKLLTGIGKVCLGELIMIDSGKMDFTKVKLAPRRGDCGVCGALRECS
ncbi:MAG: HesA/MoeB/ThiF family protein [Verrucomicrobiales bacterium]|nr:HesA/MoeB/ThiF family protein [Verrucomicrobiales bacterium]